MTCAFTGSFVYSILLLIDAFALAPVASANDADHVTPICETHRKNSLVNASEAVKALLRLAMCQVSGYYTLWVQKRLLSEGKTDVQLF